MTRQPVTMALTPRRRNVLNLRACGMSHAQIGAYLGVTPNVVRKDLIVITNRLVPGSTDTGEAKGYRLMYIMGLLDAGAEPEDVPDYIKALTARVDMRLAQTVPDLLNTGDDEDAY